MIYRKWKKSHLSTNVQFCVSYNQSNEPLSTISHLFKSISFADGGSHIVTAQSPRYTVLQSTPVTTAIDRNYLLPLVVISRLKPIVFGTKLYIEHSIFSVRRSRVKRIPKGKSFNGQSDERGQISLYCISHSITPKKDLDGGLCCPWQAHILHYDVIIWPRVHQKLCGVGNFNSSELRIEIGVDRRTCIGSGFHWVEATSVW